MPITTKPSRGTQRSACAGPTDIAKSPAMHHFRYAHKLTWRGTRVLRVNVGRQDGSAWFREDNQ